MEQSLKHESPGDVSKRDGGGPEERNGGLHPLYLIPGFFCPASTVWRPRA